MATDCKPPIFPKPGLSLSLSFLLQVVEFCQKQLCKKVWDLKGTYARGIALSCCDSSSQHPYDKDTILFRVLFMFFGAALYL